MIFTGLSGHAWAWAVTLDRTVKPMTASVLNMGHLPIRSALMNREFAGARTGRESAAYPGTIVRASMWAPKEAVSGPHIGPSAPFRRRSALILGVMYLLAVAHGTVSNAVPYRRRSRSHPRVAARRPSGAQTRGIHCRSGRR